MIKGDFETMTVGGGCFWCIGAIMNEVKGVEKVISGFSGGKVPGKPTYKEVCSGLTGHAEVVEVSFDANVIKFEALLTIFMMNHDPTTLNLKEMGFGSQYRSVIFYHNAIQHQIATAVTKDLSTYFDRPITTEITSAENFHIAEASHQNYYSYNKDAAYCQAIIAPKLAKLRIDKSETLISENIKMKSN